MDQLIEGVLAIGARLAPDDRTGGISHGLAIERHRLAVRFHVDKVNDDNAAHGRGAFFLHLSFKTQFADGFPNLLALQPSDDAFAGNQSQKQAQDSCQRSTERDVFEHAGAGNAQFVEMFKQVV